MSMPDWDRAEYVSGPQRIIEPDEPAGVPVRGNFALALVLGVLAAALGCAGYALVGLSGFMVSIVAIAVGWLVGKAMMTGSGGVGGRPYQVAAVILTYFACSTGDLLDELHASQLSVMRLLAVRPDLAARWVLAGPFLRLSSPLNGVLGLVILFIGLRAAWGIAAGGPGLPFRMGGGQSSGLGPFGGR